MTKERPTKRNPSLVGPTVGGGFPSAWVWSPTKSCKSIKEVSI